MNKWLILAVGGISGTFARYLAAIGVASIAGSGFPYGTLVVNLSACLLIGMFDGMTQARGALGPESRLLLMTGFCGAYSTFSTWMLETSNLMADGETAAALGNVVGSVALGFLLFRLGAYLGARI